MLSGGEQHCFSTQMHSNICGQKGEDDSGGDEYVVLTHILKLFQNVFERPTQHIMVKTLLRKGLIVNSDFVCYFITAFLLAKNNEKMLIECLLLLSYSTISMWHVTDWRQYDG